MICLNCGRMIDANNPVCPYCGTPVDSGNAYYQNDGNNYDAGYEQDGGQDYEQGYDQGYGQAYEQPYEQDYDDYEQEQPAARPVSAQSAKPAVQKPKMDIAGGGFNLSTILSGLSLLVSIICLISISGIKGAVSQEINNISGSIYSVQSSLYGIEDRISGLDSTIAGVQSEAYNQLAAQNITITKDVTALTGPVTQGKYNQMFIVTAKGNLNLATSFDWQKYNESTGGWVSIVFTGTATSNDEYGLRLENTMEDGAYKSILWANGITPAAAGSYRCIITDNTGITKTSAEAIVQVAE